MIEYNLGFLKEKGFLETSIDMEDKYDTADGDVKAVSYRFDSKNRLAYFDEFDKGDIASILKVLREMRNFDYYWFWKEGRIYAFRTFGENKQFIFNTQHSKKTEYVKSKKDKLSKFSSENPTALFDVKDVISLFYRRLWDLRLKLAKAIKGRFDDRERILAAQRLLDRLIFTYFIAEKGIIYGIDKRGRRQEVNARDLFKYLIEVSGDFHNLLNVLFFDYLNDSKKNDMPIQGAEGYSLFIPYLNGGLFRERHITTPAGESIGESELEIEGFDWKELIDALNEYNWIIDGYSDAEAEDTIGNLTPEILGHIYEKFVISVSELDDIDVSDLATTREGELKKGNKKIGAYYTPEVITKYIAENTIFPFAMDKLELGEKYENFVDFHEAHKDDADTLSRLNDALKDIKVLDPAVGSGAFPMAAADILFDWRRKCREKLDDYHLRREIIINNLHGVDIMEGAVEICMLRLWLWLIAAVDTEKEIEALPNIDFNIFEGNSLIGYVDEKEFADLKSKKKPKARWDTLTHKQFTMDNWGDEGIWYLFQQRNNKIREYRNASGERAERLRSEIKQMTDEFNRLLDGKLLKELQNNGVDIVEDKLNELKPFHWVMQFSDVFEKGGFDVVIGNPPYVSYGLRGVGKLSKWENRMLEYLFKSTEYKKPTYPLFIEQSIKLSSKSGYSSLIVPDSFLLGRYFSKNRRFILDKCKIKHILFLPFKVFIGATVGISVIYIFKNDLGVERQKCNDFKAELSTSLEDFSNNISLMHQYNQSYFSATAYNRFRLFFRKNEFEIINFIDLNSKEDILGDIVKFSSGLIGKKGKDEIISDEKNDDRWHLGFILGEEIGRYSLDTPVNFILFDTDILKSGFRNAKYNEPKLLMRQTGDTLITTYDCSNLLCLNNLHVGNILKSRYSLKTILPLLNSKLMTFYYHKISLEEGRTMAQTDIETIDKLPIPKINAKTNKIFSRNGDLLLFLNTNEERKVQFKDMIEFFDFQITDSMVYSLYFSSKFATGGIPTDLVDKISPHIKPIDYDRWAQLEFKDELTRTEMKEKQVLEKSNMAAIESVYQRLKDDKEIQGYIQQIKAHPWVRLIEEET